MKPAPFDYVAPRSLNHALDLMSLDSQDVKVIAGGQSLIPVLNMRMNHPDILVDVCRLEESRKYDVDDSGSLVIGAGITQSHVHSDPTVRRDWPLLAAGIGFIGHPQIRNRGTVCGSLAHADPAAEIPALAVLMDAAATVARATGVREIGASDFLVGTFATALEPEDLLLELKFPSQPPGSGWSFQEFSRRPGDFAAAGVAIRLSRDSRVADDARVVFFGVGQIPVRARAVEQLINGQTVDPDLIVAAQSLVPTEISPGSDIHGSSDFRTEISIELLGLGLAEAWERSS